MKQILQNLKTGVTYVEDVPSPVPGKDSILIQTINTLISTGTEKMLVDFGRAGLIGKIRKQPDKVRMVLDKIKTDGLVTTYQSVQSKLEQPLPLGYCNVGYVRHAPIGSSFKIGERVVSNGYHAEIVKVAPNLTCKIPNNVSDEDAAFAIIGAIALQGIRLAMPSLGETFVVMGLGLIGLLTVQLLKACGCKVIALDFDAQKLDQAEKYGAISISLSNNTNVVDSVIHTNNGQECDGVIMTLSTDKDEPIHNAALMTRKRGRIILVGVTGLHLARADFYEKEITFQVSCSYGPGRYDPLYEDHDQDYPIGFVRWTAQRNMEAFLDMISLGHVKVSDLIAHRFTVENASEAYELVAKGQTGLGVLLTFDHQKPLAESTNISYCSVPLAQKDIQLGVIGAGNYAQRILLPCFKKLPNVTMHKVCSTGGVSASNAARKFGFSQGTSLSDAIISDSDINTIVIATNHNSHAGYVLKCLEAGKNVFVEKPLALTLEDVERIENFYKKAEKTKTPILTIGFNRRFSPYIQHMKTLLDKDSAPKTIIMTINAGQIPPNHWTQDLEVGGGRIMGEACHFIDLSRFLTGKKIKDYTISAIPQKNLSQSDCATIILKFEDESQAIIHYLSNGHKSFPKERIEIFSSGKTLQLDNFRRLRTFGWKGAKNKWTFSQLKGQDELVQVFCQSILGKEQIPIPLDEIFEVARITIKIGLDAC
jgi:predicted dehydrogenase/threonine dehydrogenase-like Zn-dependent dehydrogenase